MTASESDWQRRPALALVADLYPAFGATLASLWPLLLLVVVRGSSTLEAAALAVELVVSLTLLVGVSAVRVAAAWWSTTWRLAGDRLEVRTGLISTQHRVIPAARVQNAEVRQDLPQRLLGLASVRVETASGEGAEGTLTGVRLEDAERVVAVLGRGARPAREAADDLVLAIGPVDLALAGAVSTRWGMLFLGALVVWDRVIVPSMRAPGDGVRAVAGAASTLGVVGALGLAAVLLGGVWVVGVAGVVVRHWGLELRRDVDGGLRLEEGLLTRRRVALPAGRVQRVEIVQGPLPRALGFAALQVESVVARSGQGGADRAAVTLPMVPDAAIDDLVRRLVPDVPPRAWTDELRPAHPRAVRREVLRALVSGVVVVALGTWWSVWLAPLLVPLALWWVVSARLDVRAQGWRVDEAYIVSRTGWLRRVTVLLPRRRVQVASWHQGPLLRTIGLAEVWVSVAGNGVSLPLVGADEGWALATSLASRRPPERSAPRVPRSDPAVDPAAAAGGEFDLDEPIADDEDALVIEPEDAPDDDLAIDGADEEGDVELAIGQAFDEGRLDLEERDDATEVSDAAPTGRGGPASA